MVKDAVRSLWNEPRAPNAPPRGWPDYVLVGVLVPGAALEVLLRTDLQWKPLALLIASVPVLALLWRRSNPLAAVVVAFTVHAAIDLTPVFHHSHDATLYSSAVVLLLPYSLLRWGSGRDAVIGVAVVLGSHAFIGFDDSFGIIEVLAGVAILLLPAALGASVRYRTVSRSREIDQVKLLEREQLARELHDTVAHHVSAIAIAAQAGRTVAVTDPEAAVRALQVIEAEASRTLTEMRTMVGALRQGEEPSLAPQRGVADIALLAKGSAGAPVVEVVPSGDLDNLSPSVDAAMYRLAQESITNAIRHARRATRIRVAVDGESDCVRLTVSDDGHGHASTTGAAATSGYGIVGMTERATLLGGTLHAGPDHDGGWTVSAVLPRPAPTS